MAPLRIAQLRRIAVHAQGYAKRHRKGDLDDAAVCLARLSCVQLDSISAVDRSHRLVMSARIGAHPEDAASSLLRAGKAFESWAHEACLIPISDYPLWRERMVERREHHWFGPVIDSDPALAKRVLKKVERDGPVRSSDFEGRSTGMWGWKPEKRMLDALWTAGELAIAGREGFQRLYDLPERVIPKKWLRAEPLVGEARLRRLCVRAVTARGALTAGGIKDHFRIEGGAKRLTSALGALVAEGELLQLEVEDQGTPVFVHADTDLDPPEPSGGTLLSPFDNLLWDRAMLRRVWGFDHVMEIYKKPHERRYGYYVMPLLAGSKLVGRADVKAERDEGRLVVKAFHPEAGVKRAAAEEALDVAADRLRRALGLKETALGLVVSTSSGPAHEGSGP